jgi:neopullulanase
MPDVQTPDWVKEAVFYQIFPDRFARSARVPKVTGLQPWGSPPTYHGYQGGDLLGVAERLDYLAELGITAIYFNPIFRSASNHRYHTHDYYQVDPMLGGNAALRELLDAAHRRGMRVVLDGVFNHASRGFFQFNDILENGPESAYLDWFTVEDWPLRPYGSRQPNYHCWWGNPALPKFNTNTPAVRQFLWDVARFWLDFGIDGWRLDVPGEIDDDEFWREFRCRVKGANPDAYIVGEIWGEADRWLQGDQFDGVMNYAVSRAAIGLFAADTLDREYRPGGFRLHEVGARQFVREIERQTRHHPWPITQTQLNLLDSHDTSRFITQAGGDQSALKLAILFLMTIPGAPCLYYGTEVGMAGGPDPDCRRAFPEDKAAWDLDLLTFTRRAIALRRTNAALQHGTFERLYASDDVCSYGRRAEHDTAVIAFNTDHESRIINLNTGDLFPDGNAIDLWGGSTAHVSNGVLRHIILAPRSAAVFVPHEEPVEE